MNRRQVNILKKTENAYGVYSVFLFVIMYSRARVINIRI